MTNSEDKSAPLTPDTTKAAADRRAARLKAALKANIAKRKAQTRARDIQTAADPNDNQDA